MLVGAIGVIGIYEFRQESSIDVGEITLPDEPGLGGRLDLDTVAEFMTDDKTLLDEA